MQPIVCPFCTQYALEPLFTHITLTARIDGESVVSGVMAYRCTENSHVFFVRKLDVDAEDPELLAPTGT
jgi:hypothetical protein